MKAMVYTKYGAPAEVLQMQEVAKPVPKDNEVLVKILATSVNAAEWHLIRGQPLLIRPMVGSFSKPKVTIPGADIAGIVEAVGSAAKQFKPGDAVFGDLSVCGWGGFAEYVAVPETALALKPANLTFEETATLPTAAITALQGLRNKGQIKAGQKVLINGASGGVGSFAVKIAKAYGAEVTGVCTTRKMESVRANGADHVIDRTKEDFVRGKERYDLIFDAGAFRSISVYKRVLTPTGRYVMVGGSTPQLFKAMVLGPLISMFGSKKLGTLATKTTQEDLVFLKELAEAGKLTPAIDKRYPLGQIANALRLLEEGNVQGKVAITVEHSNQAAVSPAAATAKRNGVTAR